MTGEDLFKDVDDIGGMLYNKMKKCSQ